MLEQYIAPTVQTFLKQPLKFLMWDQDHPLQAHLIMTSFVEMHCGSSLSS